MTPTVRSSERAALASPSRPSLPADLASSVPPAPAAPFRSASSSLHAAEASNACGSFWLDAAKDVQVAFDFLTPVSRRPASASSSSSLLHAFNDLCEAGYSEAEAFQSICLEDAARRAAGLDSAPLLAEFLKSRPEFMLQHSLPGPPAGSPSSASLVALSDVSASGLSFARRIFARHRQAVHPLSRDAAFLLVVSFGRADFRLDLLSVESALKAVLGARGSLLQVVQLADRVCRFSVCSKHVGLEITKLSAVSNRHFTCFFHLWSFGGPNWRREYALWLSENEEDWTLVQHAKRCSDNALQAMEIADKLGTQPILKKKKRPSLRPRSGRLRFADCIAYEACLVYSKPSGPPDPLAPLLVGGIACPVPSSFLPVRGPWRFGSTVTPVPSPVQELLTSPPSATAVPTPLHAIDVLLHGLPVLAPVACPPPGSRFSLGLPGHDGLSSDRGLGRRMPPLPSLRPLARPAVCSRPLRRIYCGGLDLPCVLGSRPVMSFGSYSRPSLRSRAPWQRPARWVGMRPPGLFRRRLPRCSPLGFLDAFWCTSPGVPSPFPVSTTSSPQALQLLPPKPPSLHLASAFAGLVRRRLMANFVFDPSG